MRSRRRRKRRHMMRLTWPSNVERSLDIYEDCSRSQQKMVQE
jgi:hypothetical protein